MKAGKTVDGTYRCQNINNSASHILGADNGRLGVDSNEYY